MSLFKRWINRIAMQILPSKELLPFIKHYLFLESEGENVKKLRLFSDGNTGMVFSFNSRFIQNSPDNKRLDYLPNAFVYGQISAFKDLYLEKNATLIVIVFQPFGINRLLGISANEFKDKIIPVEEIFGKQGLFLQEQLYELVSFEDKLKTLNRFFLELSSKNQIANHAIIQPSIDFILKNKGEITIGQLVKHTGYTERHIERVFNENIGLNPKKFGNIVQLHFFLKQLKGISKPNNLVEICYEMGYSDQSHLIKTFKKYTGITPTQYLNNTSKLAVNFMEISSMKTPMSDLYNLKIQT
jgi:AraC-like DNA-binding protein